MNGPAYTSLSTLSIDTVHFQVNGAGVVARTVLSDTFGVEYAFTGSPQEWIDFAMRIARGIGEHANRITDDQLEDTRANDRVVEDSKAEIRRILDRGCVVDDDGNCSLSTWCEVDAPSSPQCSGCREVDTA